MLVVQLPVVFSCCSLIFGALLVSGLKSDLKSSVSNNQLNGLETNGKHQKRSDLVGSASTSVGSRAQSLPKIYHSTIDNREIQSPLIYKSQLAASYPERDLATAAGHHHGHAYGKYYEYREVPKKKTWKFGYKRGNHKHTISRHEHGKSGKKHPHFKTKVKWHDKKSKGKGIHLWDYNHHDKKHHYG